MTEPLRSALKHRLTLGRAHAAAYDGDLAQAARLLDALDAAGEPTVEALDLRARVHAQLGELTEADRCWERVLTLTPDNSAAAAGRETIAQIAVSRRRARPVVNAGRVTVLAAALAGVVVVGGVVWLSSSGTDRQPVPVAGSAQVNAQTQRADALQRRLDGLAADNASAAGRQTDRLDAIVKALAMPGVYVTRRTGDAEVVFDDGVFVRDTDVGRASGPLLTELGHRLAGLNVTTTVVGHAVAAAGGRTSGGSTVALARAQVAAGYLARGGDGSLTAFTLATADQAQGPFPDAARNRTVTLLVVPK
ncbi:MAG: hypothetical protein JWQ81_6027 [Amycolatopsis sp.]|uniref:hypothetical protein n=1 Tax=Amycolatopsis sp. TaxID=37632 RepID=UPI0026126137|nr:hypothetical protein [Amycolatopsis sp.]MCU1685288.1 hypothetical protein [Amycolatopsis sp.]